MSAWKDIECSGCERTSHGRNSDEPAFAHCPLCSSSSIDVFEGVYDGQRVDMYDCTECSEVFNLSADPVPEYCPVCGSDRIGRFP